MPCLGCFCLFFLACSLPGPCKFLASCPCFVPLPLARALAWHWFFLACFLDCALSVPCQVLASSLPLAFALSCPCPRPLTCPPPRLLPVPSRCPRFALALLPRFSPRLCLCHCRLFFYTLFVALGFVLLSHFPCRCPCDVLALSSPCSSSLPSVPRFIVAVLAQLHNHFLPPPAGVYLTCRSPYKLFVSRAQRLLFYCVFLW